MADLLLVLLVVLVITLVIITSATLTAVWQLQRRNRLSPKVPTPAPLDWLWSPMQGARLHRRLRTVVRHVEGPAAVGADTLRDRLVEQAHALDWHLVAAASTPRRHRRSVLRELDSQVREVEDLAGRVGRLSRPAGVPDSGWRAPEPPAAKLAELRTDLDLLEAAHAELDQLEQPAAWPPDHAPLPPPHSDPLGGSAGQGLVDPRHPAAGDTPEADVA